MLAWPAADGGGGDSGSGSGTSDGGGGSGDGGGSGSGTNGSGNLEPPFESSTRHEDPPSLVCAERAAPANITARKTISLKRAAKTVQTGVHVQVCDREM